MDISLINSFKPFTLEVMRVLRINTDNLRSVTKIVTDHEISTFKYCKKNNYKFTNVSYIFGLLELLVYY